MLDPLDFKIIEELKRNARASLKEISANVNLSMPAVSKRINKLVELGYIKQFTIVLNNDLFDKQCIFFCLISIHNKKNQANDHIQNIISQHEEILEFHRILGPFDYIMKIRIGSPKELEAFLIKLQNELGTDRAVSYTVMSTLK